MEHTTNENKVASAPSGLNVGLAADKLDAERYRWLRNRFSNNWGGPYFEMLEGKGCYALKQGRELDGAIDAEILKAANAIELTGSPHAASPVTGGSDVE